MSGRVRRGQSLDAAQIPVEPRGHVDDVVRERVIGGERDSFGGQFSGTSTGGLGDLINSGVDIIIARALDSAAIGSSIRAAKAAGIPFVTFDRASSGEQPTAHVDYALRPFPDGSHSE